MKIERHAIALDEALVQRYAGAYRFSDLTVIVEVEGGRLFARIDGQEGRWEMFPESQTLFFFKAFDTDVLFDMDGDRPTAMHVRTPLRDDLKGRRIADADP